VAPEPPAPSLPPAVAPHHYTADEIVRVAAWIDRTRALTAEGLIRPPIGDIAEILITWATRGARVKPAAAGWDVETPEGNRIQVRGLWRAGHRVRTSLGRVPKIRDSIVGVPFEPDLSVSGAWELRVLPPPGTRLTLSHVKTRATNLPFRNAPEEFRLAPCCRTESSPLASRPRSAAAVLSRFQRRAREAVSHQVVGARLRTNGTRSRYAQT